MIRRILLRIAEYVGRSQFEELEEWEAKLILETINERRGVITE